LLLLILSLGCFIFCETLTMIVEYLLIPGIVGDHGVQVIRAGLGALPGVLLVTISLVGKRVRVEHTGRTNVEELIGAINQAGYDQVAVLA